MKDLSHAVSAYGKAARPKLSAPGIHGHGEFQLRGPLDGLFRAMADVCGIKGVTAIDEAPVRELGVRPDFTITRDQALVGHVEVKAPGKGADPASYTGHDRQQWGKLQNLPNLVYTDGNHFSLWRYGEQIGETLVLLGDVRTSGAALDAPARLAPLFHDFFLWEPQAPATAGALAEVAARLCGYLRAEVEEALDAGSAELATLAEDWRRYFFPEASNAEFADGYAQAVTFGLLMARVNDIDLSKGIGPAARTLRGSHTLMGGALDILTHGLSGSGLFETSLATLVRVFDQVVWRVLERDTETEVWLYFYEDFLQVYDPALRRQTGAYYTPPQVVQPMIRWVDEVLRTRFDEPTGLASSAVSIADPALGTGTFPLGILRRIKDHWTAEQGSGAVPAAIHAAVQRLFAFEKQLGPFAVAQLRLLAEVAELTGDAPVHPLRIWVADTLANPYLKEEHLPLLYKPIGESLHEANAIKRDAPITIVIGNPPYRERAKGHGGWIEAGGQAAEGALLADWMPPRRWGVSAHVKHLYNLYIYFWRWATWKVFEQQHKQGVVCFITVAGFLNGPGFERMREYLRLMASEIWVVDCSPEGHQPGVATRVFQGVQQPVCIVLAARRPAKAGVDKSGLSPREGATRPTEGRPAQVWFRALPAGSREAKFDDLAGITLDGEGWTACPSAWRAPFLPGPSGVWADCVPLGDLFVYNGSGVMPGRTWVIAPDPDSLLQRWETLKASKGEAQWEARFRSHMPRGKLGDRHPRRTLRDGLPGHEYRATSVFDDTEACVPPIRYGHRSFDRQWIIPDKRLINRPNPGLWSRHSDAQVYMTALMAHAPTSGPGLTFTGLIPDLHHYKGSFGGRFFPLWADADATAPNTPPALLAALTNCYEALVTGPDLMAYVAAVAAHPGYTATFSDDLVQPGLRIPLTADPDLFAEAVAIGRRIIWLHTFGERYADPAHGRPRATPRLPDGERPRIPESGAIPHDRLPEHMDYEPTRSRLVIGDGHIEPVPPPVWNYEISGKQVLRQWFSYREKNRERPVVGRRRPPSPLNTIAPAGWPATYTSELLAVIEVLGLLVKLEPDQRELLACIIAGPLLTREALEERGAFVRPKESGRATARAANPDQIVLDLPRPEDG